MDQSILPLLSGIYQCQPVTRHALADQTGLGINRVNTLIPKLITWQLVREEAQQAGTPGRPAGLLSINPNVGKLVGLDIDGEHSRAVLTDLTGRVLAQVIHPTQAVPDREVILNNMIRLLEDVCQEGSLKPNELAGLGVGLRGLVNGNTGTVLGWPNTPAWSAAWTGMNVPDALRKSTGIELIVIEDSARTMGLDAYRFGPARGCDNFLYVFLGNGIGAAHFSEGHAYRGSIGLAGEIGHVTAVEDGAWCSCGNRGCLETLASTTAVMRRVRERLAEVHIVSALREPSEKDGLNLAALMEAARAGDKIAFQILDETGELVGKVLGIALNLLGPELVVLGGSLVQDDDILLEAVRRQVRLRALPLISNRTRILADDQGEFAGARGAALLALDTLISSPAHLARFLDSVHMPVG